MEVISLPAEVVRALFISPGHNFVGHHEQPPGEHPILAVPQVHCLAGRGLEGDRYLDHRADFKGQITFFAEEVFEAVKPLAGDPGVTPAALRRNVLTRGVDLGALVGRTFELQGVRFVGVEECRPCYWMDHAVGPGAELSLKGRGGLRARIVTSGVLAVAP